MGAPKGSRNAAKYHQANADELLSKLSAVCDQLPAGMKFVHLTALSEYLAPFVGQTAGNLRRNLAYRAALLRVLTRQPGAAAIVSARDDDPKFLQARLELARLEASNAKADVARLRKRIEKLTQHQAPAELGPSGNTNKVLNHVGAFEATAHALALVLGRIEGLEVDFERAEIVDRGARPGDQVIVKSNHAKPFVVWLKETR